MGGGRGRGGGGGGVGVVVRQCVSLEPKICVGNIGSVDGGRLFWGNTQVCCVYGLSERRATRHRGGKHFVGSFGSPELR